MASNDEVLAEADYNDGKITLQLPTTVAAGYLYGIGYDFSSTIEVSNPNAQMSDVYIRGYKGDRQVCRFYYEMENERRGIYANGYLDYVNCALTVNGTETETNDRDITRIYEDIYTYSINAKRGWNMWYTIREDNTETPTANGIKWVYKRERTTTDPGGLKWTVEFRDYDYDGVTAGDELNITAQVENGTAYSNIKRVRADGYRYALAVGSYRNGGFSLTIPNKAYPEMNIEYFFSYYFDIYSSSGINISNKNASVDIIESIRGYSSSTGEWSGYVGDFIYGKASSNSATFTYYMFTDMDVNITGSGSSDYYGDIYNFNMNLKAGWNTVYMTVDANDNITMSTASVSGLKWYFEDDVYNMSSLSVKRLTNKNLNSKSAKSRLFKK
jgi:hypothetical protein